MFRDDAALERDSSRNRRVIATGKRTASRVSSRYRDAACCIANTPGEFLLLRRVSARDHRRIDSFSGNGGNRAVSFPRSFLIPVFFERMESCVLSFVAITTPEEPKRNAAKEPSNASRTYLVAKSYESIIDRIGIRFQDVFNGKLKRFEA